MKINSQLRYEFSVSDARLFKRFCNGSNGACLLGAGHSDVLSGLVIGLGRNLTVGTDLYGLNPCNNKQHGFNPYITG